LKDSIEKEKIMSQPSINVTPLIDVLLVLLIIFMIIAPSKPTDFKARIPREPNKDENVRAHPWTLVVALNSDSSLRLNTETVQGTVDDTVNLTARLSEIFRQREKNHYYWEDRALRTNIPESEKIEKTVFIKAPRSVDYGSVAKVVDAVNLAGADPISLQIDDLE
jgi:biopolymer transport protein ExbD